MKRAKLLPFLLLALFPGVLLGQNAPGLHELVIYKPGVHDRDLPKPIFDKINEHCDSSKEGGQRITIPPTVHVHRYYYSGNKEYQGPIVAGGPTMVVARHPKTGQQMYVDVVLPSGAPKIAYTKSSITYVYPKKRVTINFRGFPFDQNLAVVDVKSGHGMARTANNVFSKNWAKLKKMHNESPLTEMVRSSSQDVKNMVSNLGRGAGNVLKQGYDSAKSVVEVIPGVKPLLDPSRQEAQRAYNDKIQAADSKARRLAPKFIRTNR